MSHSVLVKRIAFKVESCRFILCWYTIHMQTKQGPLEGWLFNPWQDYFKHFLILMYK